MSQAAATYLLRVRLPDQPGVLGKVATALGAAGADIDSVIVVDRFPGYAVDDLVVTLPVGSLADRLVSAATSVEGVAVETVQRHHGRQRLHDDLALLDAAAASDRPVAALADGLPGLIHASYAIVVEVASSGAEPATLAASMSAPDTACRRDWLPLDGPRGLAPDQVWDDPAVAGPDCELAGVPFRDTAAIVLGRIGGPPFRPAELTRLAHLSRVAQALFATPYPT